jgi:hypothetical protein
MKKILAFLSLISFILCSCASLQTNPPKDFSYVEIKTDDYVLASWQKIKDEQALIKIYIEGDGHAYTSKGYPTKDPTPKSHFLRDIAFDDTSENVVYLARPCQYIKSNEYKSVDWTTGRFSWKIVNNMAQAIKLIAGDKNVILIGYSGGALLCGLIINEYQQELHIVKWITIAGLLNHTRWTRYFNYTPLRNSMDLDVIPNIPQIHYIGKKDTVIPYWLTLQCLDERNCVVIENATHNKGFDIEAIINN